MKLSQTAQWLDVNELDTQPYLRDFLAWVSFDILLKYSIVFLQIYKKQGEMAGWNFTQ